MSTKRTRLRRVKAETQVDWSGNSVWSIPRTADAYDAMVEQMAKAKARSEGYRYTRFMYGYQDDAGIMLRAIGITRPKD